MGAKATSGTLDIWAVLALLAFALCVGGSIVVLLPHALVFAFRGAALLAESDHAGVEDVKEAYRAAGLWIEPHLNTNAVKIGELSAWFTASCVLLGAEVVLWTISLTS